MAHESPIQPDHLSSFWEKDTYLRPVDFLIVGAGITGLNAAISIKARHPRATVRVIDRGIRGDGASYRNAGFACLGSPTELLADLEESPPERVWAITRLRYEGLQMLRSRIPDEDMDIVWCGGMEIFDAGEQDVLGKVTSRLGELNQQMEDITGKKAHFRATTSAALPYQQVCGGIRIGYEGRLHPGKMMAALYQLAQRSGVEILHGVTVNAWEEAEGGVELMTSDGRRLRTAYLGWATNGFTRDAGMDLPVFPARNQVYLTAPLPGPGWDECLHYHQGYVYARRVGDRILIGGARHIAREREAISASGLTEDISQWLHAFASRHLGVPAGQPFDSAWSGTMGVGAEKGPILMCTGNRIAVGVRLGGMGVAMGTLVGDQLANLMTA